jgi:hypothetical protein
MKEVGFPAINLVRDADLPYGVVGRQCFAMGVLPWKSA